MEDNLMRSLVFCVSLLGLAIGALGIGSPPANAQEEPTLSKEAPCLRTIL